MISVIGGSGFIGTRFCKFLAERQIVFEIIDLKPSRSFPERSKICDIRDLERLKSVISGDYIVHLAAVHRDDVSDKSLYYSTNVDGTRNVCLTAEHHGINKIVFTSTVAVYGLPKSTVDVDSQINPFNDYGASKFEGEEAARAWHAQDASTRILTIIRPTVVFGEGNRGNVYNLLNQIASGRFVMVGNGENKKSLAYVGNIVAFLNAAVEHGDGYALYNYIDEPDFDMNRLVSKVRHFLGRKEKVGVRLPYFVGIVLGYVADSIAYVTGKRLPISSVRVKKFCASTSFKSNKSTLDGFVAPFDLEEALQKTVHSEFIDVDPDMEIFFTE